MYLNKYFHFIKLYDKVFYSLRKTRDSKVLCEALYAEDISDDFEDILTSSFESCSEAFSYLYKKERNTAILLFKDAIEKNSCIKEAEELNKELKNFLHSI